MKRSRIVGVSLVAALAIAVGGGGCSSESGVNAAEARHYITEQMQARSENADIEAPLFRTLDEVLPNVTYVYPDGTTKPGSHLVVVGRFTTVERGRGWYVPGDDHPSGILTDFDDERAKWRSIHATVDIEKALGGPYDGPDEITVYLPLYNKAEFDRWAAGLPALGRVVVFLERHNPLVSYDPSLYVMGYQHALLAAVDEGGSLTMPFLASGEAARLLAPVPTLSELETRATLPRTVTLVPGPGGAMRP